MPTWTLGGPLPPGWWTSDFSDSTCSDATSLQDQIWQSWTSNSTTTITQVLHPTTGIPIPARVETYGTGRVVDPRFPHDQLQGARIAAADLRSYQEQIERRAKFELLLKHEEALECNADWLHRTLEEKARDIAKTKALALLCEHLDRFQIGCLVKYGYFTVVSESGKLYRIDQGHARNIRLLASNGKTIHSVYCAHPKNAYELPDCDTMLVQTLMLKFSEHEFLKIANLHSLNAEIIRHSDAA